MKSARFILVIASISVLLCPGTGLSAPKINKDAEAIARAMPKYSPRGKKNKAEGSMKNLISMLAATKRNSHSSNSALMKKAMDFRNDIGAQQKTVSTGAVLKAWETAYSLGAIGENNKFTGVATRGRYQGDKLIFENIVPDEALPGVSGYIGNLRMVPESLARQKDAPLSIRDRGFIPGLQKVVHESKSYAAMLEIQKSKVGDLAYKPGEAEAKYEAERQAAGDLVNNTPNLRISAQRLSSPSRMNDNRYRVKFDVINLSRHPTEISLEYLIVGYTDNENKLYEMKRHSETVKLRRNQSHAHELWTPNIKVFSKPLEVYDPEKSKKVIYRGYMMTAKFKGETIATAASDGRLNSIVTGKSSTPIPNILGMGKKKK